MALRNKLTNPPIFLLCMSRRGILPQQLAQTLRINSEPQQSNIGCLQAKSSGLENESYLNKLHYRVAS